MSASVRIDGFASKQTVCERVRRLPVHFRRSPSAAIDAHHRRAPVHFIELKRPTFVRVLVDVRKAQGLPPGVPIHGADRLREHAPSSRPPRLDRGAVTGVERHRRAHFRRIIHPSRTAREGKRDDRRDADGDADATPATATRVRTRRAHDGARRNARSTLAGADREDILH